jgi:cell division protease FtsH
MGGRAAGKGNFQQNFNRSIKRFRKVTKQARAMVTVYGLNEKIGT